MKQLTLVVPVLFSSLALLSQAPAAKAQDLPEGKGKDLVDQVCGACHGTDLVSARRATKEGWGYIVDDMVSRGASASDDQVKTIKEYLAKNFGQVNVNKADSAEIASVLEITPAQADAAVLRVTGRLDADDAARWCAYSPSTACWRLINCPVK